MSQDKGSKTEKPTPKRLRDAKKKGQVCLSKEIVSTATFFGVTIAFLMVFGKFIQEVVALFDHIGSGFKKDISRYFVDYIMDSVGILLKYSLIFTVTAVVCAIVACFLQHGGVFSFEKLKPNFNTLNPINGAKNIFSKKNLVDFFKSLAKVICFGCIIFIIIYFSIASILNSAFCGIGCFLEVAGITMLKIFIAVIIIGIILSVIDYIAQYKIYISDLKMSKDDIKREHKDVEGNPEVKQKRKEFHRQILEENVDRVKMADVVVTNPTHYAVCIYYKEEKTQLPIVVLKAEGFEAQEVKEIARSENVPMVENVFLARSLYSQAELDRYVPNHLLTMVASVLNVVKMEKNKH